MNQDDDPSFQRGLAALESIFFDQLARREKSKKWAKKAEDAAQRAFRFNAEMIKRKKAAKAEGK